MNFLTKLVRGFTGGIIGLIFGAVAVSVIAIPIVFGVFWFGGPIAGAIIPAIFGLNLALKNAYASYHLGLWEGFNVVFNNGFLNLAWANFLNDVRTTHLHIDAAQVEKQRLEEEQKQFLENLERAEQAPVLNPLTEEEQDVFLKNATDEEKQQLSKYNALLHNKCSITNDDFKEYTDKQSELVTLERERKQEGQLSGVIDTFTFNRESLKQWSNKKSTNPLTQEPLKDFTVYKGFPKWMATFVNSVREKLAKLVKVSDKEAKGEVKVPGHKPSKRVGEHPATHFGGKLHQQQLKARGASNDDIRAPLLRPRSRSK